MPVWVAAVPSADLKLAGYVAKVLGGLGATRPCDVQKSEALLVTNASLRFLDAAWAL